jgi:tetratricopeptide (TPR) repeat protein
MPGNREAYEQAMNAGHSAAWDQDWMVAVAAYGRAVQEFPADPEAHIHLGLGLLEMGRLEDALKVYTRAHQLAETDPIPLEKSADVLERMGRLREAAQQYINVSEVYLQQRDLEKAIANWDRATQLTPGLVAIHAKLAQAYERIGDKKSAVREYLTLAFNFQKNNDSERAIRAAQRALRLDRNNAQVLNTLRALESGTPIQPPSNDNAPAPPPARSTFDKDAKKTAKRDEPPPASVEADPMGPMGEAMNEALGALAIYVMEQSGAFTVSTDALQAMEAQRQGLYAEAIEAYERAEPRVRHPALKMNLGGLLVMHNRADAAIKHLGEASTASPFAAGAYHALGVAYNKLGRHKQASRFLLQALGTVGGGDEVSDLNGALPIFEELNTVLGSATDEQLTTINNRFVELLQGKDWRSRVNEARRQLEETLREQGERGLLDILTAQRGDKLTESISLIDRFVRRGLYTLAMDEAHRAVEFSPNYLPIHVRMAEIMIKEGRVRNAITKYNTIARSYLSRGENQRAADILTSVLEMAPLDVSVRESLIDLLETEERWDDALDQYIELAHTHQQLGNFDQARETYVLAERLATRINAVPERMAKVKHAIADIDLLRTDFRKAQKTYEEIVQLLPDDERAHRQLMELHYRQKNNVEAMRRLDKLLGIYARNKQINRITQLLEELVLQEPNDTALRSRLASIYRHLGRTKEAISQLDALGELQLDAGQHAEAANTIRLIITLKPDHVEDYRKLLQQLGG